MGIRLSRALPFRAVVSKGMFTYALVCGEGHVRPFWYIGRTENLERRLRQHWSGHGAQWCKLHKPSKLWAVHAGDIEDSLTLAFMHYFGWEVVRGGKWVARSMGKPKALGQYKPHDMSATQQISDVKIENWKIGPAVKNKHGGQIWPITSSIDSKAHPKFQLGGDSLQLRCPFGPSCFGAEISDRQNLDYAISPWLDQIKEFLAKLDKHIVDHVWANVSEFYPKRKFNSKSELESLYCPILNTKNDDFDPLMKTKINVNTQKVFEISEDGHKKSDYRCITSGCGAVPVCQATKVWKMSDKFGCTVTTEAVLVWPKREKEAEEIFITNLLIRPEICV